MDTTRALLRLRMVWSEKTRPVSRLRRRSPCLRRRLVVLHAACAECVSDAVSGDAHGRCWCFVA